MSRLKSYIDGKLKFCDIIHPSKIPNPNQRSARHCITYYTNSHKFELYPDTKLKNWNRRVESKLASYINGETSARDLVHPSKFPQLSNEVLRQKLQKNRLLQSQQRNNAHQRPRLKSSDWIELGKQLETQCAAHRQPTEDSPEPERPAEQTFDLLPVDAKLAAEDAIPMNREAPSNTVVFNGNVNILCFSVAAQPADRICDDVKRELRMLSTYTVLPAEQPGLQLLGSGAATEVDNSCGILRAVASSAPRSDVHELATIVNELLPAVQTLRSQYKRALADCKELSMERKILLKHQEISDKTIALLSDETAELKERQEQLLESSDQAVQRLRAETRQLTQENQRLQQSVEQLQLSERELLDVNRVLLRELQRKSSEQEELRTLLAGVKRHLRAKLVSLDRCFDAIDRCVRRAELEADGLRANCGFTEKQALVNTIRRLDDQNSNLMGKVKHMPEKIRSILNHISGTMSSLEEQNIRLLRTLQNSENETFLQNNFLRHINNVS